MITRKSKTNNLKRLLMYIIQKIESCNQSKLFVKALGCILYLFCFNKHPFDEESNLAILNCNYKIPQSDRHHAIFCLIGK